MDAPDPTPPIDQLFADSYRELKRLAHARLRGSGPDLQLDTTTLVHESFLKLCRAERLSFDDRTRFLVYASRVMRSIVIDLVRHRQTERAGGDARHLALTGEVLESAGLNGDEETILRVHEALLQLEQVDERMARVVEMRYFGGLSDLEIAQALGVTDRTVRRDWAHARLVLADALR
ncbi:MAG: ECF-type sigma factor [Rubrivivax sp.]